MKLSDDRVRYRIHRISLTFTAMMMGGLLGRLLFTDNDPSVYAIPMFIGFFLVFITDKD